MMKSKQTISRYLLRHHLLLKADLTTACVPAAVQFTDHSTSPPGSSVTSWQWDFGDGGTSTQQNPSHTYTNTRILYGNLANYQQ